MRCFNPVMATGAANSSPCLRRSKPSSPPPPPTVGIVAFEAAKAMSRLVALHNSLSKDGFSSLRSGPVKSVGVTFLNSDDESYLLGLAYAEKLQDLDRAAATVSRLSHNCLDKELVRFGAVYESMKQGKCDLPKFDLGPQKAVKMIERMEKLVTATANLHKAMGMLRELELQEKRVQQWRKNGRSAKHAQNVNLKVIAEKILLQKRQTKRFREMSIWNQTFDKMVGFMSQITFFVFVRFCVVFGPFVVSLPRIPKNTLIKPGPNLKLQSSIRIYPDNCCLLEDRDKYIKRSPKGGKKTAVPGRLHKLEEGNGFGFPAPVIPVADKVCDAKRKEWLQSAQPNTLGGLGLALRYANVIILAKRFLHTPEAMNEESRAHLWGLLPGGLKQTVRGKLKSYWCKEAEDREGDEALAGDWATAVEEIIGWLAPVAHDTVLWQQERTMEKQRFDAKPTVLLLQTLHFSDLEKTEAAIVEVLVGLTCMFRTQMRRLGEAGRGDRSR